MNAEEELISALAFLNRGHQVMRMLEAGPKVWEHIGSVEMKPGMVGDFLALIAADDTLMGETYISERRGLLHSYVDQLADAFEEWARDHDRPDLLATVRERLQRVGGDG